MLARFSGLRAASRGLQPAGVPGRQQVFPSHPGTHVHTFPKLNADKRGRTQTSTGFCIRWHPNESHTGFAAYFSFWIINYRLTPAGPVVAAITGRARQCQQRQLYILAGVGAEVDRNIVPTTVGGLVLWIDVASQQFVVAI